MGLWIRLCLCAFFASTFLAFAVMVQAGQEQSSEPAAIFNPMDGLQNKIKEVVALKNDLEQKRKEMQNARTEYQDDIGKLKVEIDHERNSNKIDDFTGALKNKRVRNNLMLIQRQLAYIDKINKLEYTLSQGIEELLYLERKAKADLKIVKLLDNKDELVQKIDQSLKNYAPYATKFALDQKTLKFTPLAKIWQEISPQNAQSSSMTPPPSKNTLLKK